MTRLYLFGCALCVAFGIAIGKSARRDWEVVLMWPVLAAAFIVVMIVDRTKL